MRFNSFLLPSFIVRFNSNVKHVRGFYVTFIYCTSFFVRFNSNVKHVRGFYVTFNAADDFNDQIRSN